MDGTLIEPTRMRAAIARRMSESKRQAPHFYVQTEVAMDGLLAELDRPDAHVTVTAGLARACVEALCAHPAFNSVWTADGLLQADEVNLGVAIALEGGLVAPALIDADRLDLLALAAALRDLVERARANRLRPVEISDATFTLTNLGMFGVTAFTPIVTPPQIAILATARPVERWSMRDGEPTRQALMTATLSADHSAVDGVDAAKFLETFKAAVENPESLLREPTHAKETMS